MMKKSDIEEDQLIIEEANNRLLEQRKILQAKLQKNEVINCIKIKQENGIEREPGQRKISGFNDLVKFILRKIKQTRNSKENELLQIWESINSEEVNKATCGIENSNGFITVKISNFIIKNELENFLANSLLIKFRDKMPGKVIRGIKFKIVRNTNYQ